MIESRHERPPEKLTWLDGVLDADHRRPVPAAHAFQHLVLGQVGATVLHPDTRLHVVEVAAVQLEELNEEVAQVDVGAPRVDPRVQLSPARREAAVKKSTQNKNLRHFFKFAKEGFAKACERRSLCFRVDTCKKLMAIRVRL